MGTPDKMVPTIAGPAAPFVTWGLLLLFVGGPIAALSSDESPGVLLGAVALLVGAILLLVGVYRLVQHADRAAGVRYPSFRVSG